jgi:MFS superfamily sulfate permease-like transporter
MVVIGTFAWNSIKFLMMVPKSDALVTVLVTVVTVLEDLAVAGDCRGYCFCISLCMENSFKN